MDIDYSPENIFERLGVHPAEKTATACSQSS